MSEMVEDIAEDRKQIAEIKEVLTPKKNAPVVAEQPESSADSDDNSQSPGVLRKVWLRPA